MTSYTRVSVCVNDEVIQKHKISLFSCLCMMIITAFELYSYVTY